jgi:hypothetical protein
MNGAFVRLIPAWYSFCTVPSTFPSSTSQILLEVRGALKISIDGHKRHGDTTSLYLFRRSSFFKLVQNCVLQYTVGIYDPIAFFGLFATSLCTFVCSTCIIGAIKVTVSFYFSYDRGAMYTKRLCDTCVGLFLSKKEC